MDIIVPVIRPREFHHLMSDIANQTVAPRKIIVIDNISHEQGKGESLSYLKSFPIEKGLVQVITQNRMMKVNESWRMGFKECEDPCIAVLNDDCRISYNYVRIMEFILDAWSGTVGAVCPTTVDKWPLLPPKSLIGTHEKMRRREGWAWCIRKHIIDSVPPIPDELETFCGDDWYWEWTHRLKMIWVKSAEVLCHHVPGVSWSKDMHPVLKKEKEIYAQKLSEY